MRRIGDWTVAIEDCGWPAQWETLAALSGDGREAVTVQRHDYAAQHHLAYAVDGELVTDINPAFPLTGVARIPIG
ncbi:hypothetical protein ACNF49_25100 [Actinomadura sp. ATCC 39365]